MRDTVQMREAAALDHRAATGMLDARTVAGDAGLVLALRSEVLADWRRDARRRLAEVREAREARIAGPAGWPTQPSPTSRSPAAGCATG